MAKSTNRADFLSATEIRHLTAAFETCDKAETGELGFGPFMKCLAVMGKKVTKEEAQVYFDRMDADKSGFITLDEWIGFYANFMVRFIYLVGYGDEPYAVVKLNLMDGSVSMLFGPFRTCPCCMLRLWVQQFDVDEKELLDSFIGLWQQPTALFPETCQRYEEEEFIPKEKLFEIMTK